MSVVLLIVDGGCWRDPAVHGPYETRDAAVADLTRMLPGMAPDEYEDAATATAFVDGDTDALVVTVDPPAAPVAVTTPEGTLTAWDCIGRVPATHHVRVVGGRALYDDAIYNDATSRTGRRVKLARIDPVAPTPGRLTATLCQVNRWVDADTRVELVRHTDGAVENDALLP